jgi:hypothetical protein
VYGDVKVNLNGLEPADYVPAIHNSSLVTDVDNTDGTYYRANNGCVVTGNVYGCNNINGTPKGHAKVHVFKTVNSDSKKNTKDDDTPVASRTTYDVAAVFGGGNATDYVPVEAPDAKQSTEVIIEGCDLTSIEAVYGGGYGAAVPGTEVLIKGTYIIDKVFGGGFGASTDTYTNPGANVGYLTDGTTAYGKNPSDLDYKTANVKLMAGTVRHVYGASNTQGDIRGGSSVTTVEKTVELGNCTELYVDDIHGGGQDAPMTGGAEIVLGCMSNDWVDEVYAGAANADVHNDVSLTITSGKFGRVFGGNKSGGTIDGYIEVNIEENPECDVPIVIGELYGGGNRAAYTIPQKYIDDYKSEYGEDADYPSPRINVRAFTSIGNIFGGGFGESAIVTGNPTININEIVVEGGGIEYSFANDNSPKKENVENVIDGVDVIVHNHEKGKMGVIGKVFGGGNAAKVIGNTNVNIGTKLGKEIYFVSFPDDPKIVAGADVRGNVYGGGNNAEVTGNTNVVIGRKEQ